ncbi:MAG: phosphatidate cytidylyltransferase [Deltaproteobacteria bacterium]|nr:phosphatidate cytidylyltransferase [Deltaproteobacteria bacterium]MBW2128162.1 phosphatidate cytidylyltransferase [Deltaproteobacteria bacterium]MBW2302843.1 phosphatidate cytidylyltransferase [Deltaproteobacteria bacterium]
MHLKRWLTGIVAVPVLIYLIGIGPRWCFHLLVAIFGVIGLWEFFKIACPGSPAWIKGGTYGLALCLFLSASLGNFYSVPVLIFLFAALPLALLMLFTGISFRESIDWAGRTVLGSVYICVPLSFLIIIDRFPKGNYWIFFLLFVVFASDTGAFYVGRTVGKHKLYPSVSPGKTWEGAVAGLLSGIGGALVFPFLLPLYRVRPGILLLAGALSVLGQIGDLVESMIKRLCGVKDSGGILPGHGGVLDRIDALLFAVPLLYLYLSWSA